MKNIILMVNGVPGLAVTKFLVEQKENILRVYLHNEKDQHFANEIIEASRCDKTFLASSLKNKQHVKNLSALDIDFIFTVYWAYLLSEDVIKSARDTINFHPSLLPINRGWYPHVYNIIDDTPAGVTLHRIDVGADTGDIWVQKKVEVSVYDTAKSLYDKLIDEILLLFMKNWRKIKYSEIIPYKQNHQKANYNRKKDVADLDELHVENDKSLEDFIKIIRSRSFGNKGFSYFIKNGKKVYINLRLSKTNNFE
jgi:methionyl-tRNA formyltransferase